MPIGYQIRGLNEMQKRIAALREVVRDQGAREAAKAGATIIRDEMRTAAHVAQSHTSQSTALAIGEMKAGIRYYVRKPEKGVATAVIGPLQRLAHVAYWVEFGHRLIKGGRSRILPSGKASGAGREIGEVQPYPFIRPAFEASIRTAAEAAAMKMREFFREVLH